MKKQPLLPRYFSRIGWTLLITGILLYCWKPDSETFGRLTLPVILNDELLGETYYFTLSKVPVFHTVILLLVLTSLAFIAFAKVKSEDEYINSLRLNSWLWAIMVTCIVLAICNLFVYGVAFLMVSVYDIYLPFLIFICRFYYLLYKSNKAKIL